MSYKNNFLVSKDWPNIRCERIAKRRNEVQIKEWNDERILERMKKLQQQSLISSPCSPSFRPYNNSQAHCPGKRYR